MKVRPQLLLITGPSATGKTTLASQLAESLELPVLHRDTIKETLHDVLGGRGRRRAAKRGAAAFETLYALVPTVGRNGLIVEGNLRGNRVPDTFAEGHAVREVFLTCSVEERVRRSRERERHAVHAGRNIPDRLLARMFAADSGDCHPVARGWPVLEVDTQ